MDALFIAINAKYIHTNNAVRLLHANSAFHTDYLEFTIHDDLETITQTILNKAPKIIGISTYIWNVEETITLTHMLKEKIDTPIILGGPEVSYDPYHFLDNTPVDVIVRGEGEAIIDTLIDALINQKPLTNISNITTKKIHTPLTEIKDLSRLKSPYLNPKDTPHIPKKIAYIEASRGCPYKCSYCLSSQEKTVRFFPTQTVINHITYLQKQGAKTFKFLDRTFNANKSMLSIINHIIKTHEPGQTYQFEITGDTLDPKIVEHLHQNAPKDLFRFEIGIQSTNEATNISVDRIQNNEKLFNIIKTIQDKHIIALHLDLIAGLPKEDLKTFKKTFNDVYALNPKELQLGFLKMLRGTKIRNQAERYNYQYNPKAPYQIIQNKWLSKKDIETLTNLEDTLNTFHNKNHFGPILAPLINNHFTPADFFLDLYTYTQENAFNLHHYQLDELFKLLVDFLKTKEISKQTQTNIHLHYLTRSKVKPKTYFSTVENKTIKQTIYKKLTHQTNIPLHIFYKHSIILEANKQYHIVLYQNHQATSYTIKKVDL